MHYYRDFPTRSSYPHSNFLHLSMHLIGWILLIVLAVAIIKAISRQNKQLKQNEIGNSDEALKILKVRYAKGEISRKEFEEMKKDIS